MILYNQMYLIINDYITENCRLQFFSNRIHPCITGHMDGGRINTIAPQRLTRPTLAFCHYKHFGMCHVSEVAVH